ncbi:MAG: HNH endonuclease [Paludibacteraceae bacterium]|nr:HNH endonuclease [Paludibacteraceae bacterium]
MLNPIFPHITPEDDYSEVKECDYKGEHYSVRANGAIMRHSKSRKRPKDEIWTFGDKDFTNGYMLFCGARVHIIVATAFYGEKDSKVYVVDHKDTNRCNNRPENLRWLTRLENALNNPATRKRIEYLCGGDIQKFIDDPSCLQDLTGSNNDIMWMRTVTKEEARNAYANIMSWAEKPSSETEPTGKGLGEWIFAANNNATPNPDQQQNQHITLFTYWGPNTYTLYESLTPTAKQGDWRTPTEFLCCPLHVSETPLEDYFANLQSGAIYTKNQHGESKVLDYALSENKEHLWILSYQEDAIKPWAITEIVVRDNYFLHLNQHTYFREDGGLKYFTILQGKEWTGGEVFDDGVM